VDQQSPQKKTNRKWILVAAGVFGISLITAGVFASTQITVNGTHYVNLGAGSTTVNVCGTTATISAAQTYLSSNGVFNTTTFSITGLGTGCGGKLLSMAFNNQNGIQSATWTIPSSPTGAETYEYGYGSNGTCSAGGKCEAQSQLTPCDTAGANATLSTVAIAVQ